MKTRDEINEWMDELREELRELRHDPISWQTVAATSASLAALKWVLTASSVEEIEAKINSVITTQKQKLGDEVTLVAADSWRICLTWVITD